MLKIAFRAIQLLIVAVLGLASSSSQSQQASNAYSNTYNREALYRAKAHEYLSYLNLTADPCQDFYEFACGGWARAHAAPLVKDVNTTPAQLLQLRLNKDLQLLLAAQAQDKHPNSEKVYDLFQSCMQARNTAAEQQAFLLGFIKEHGGLSSIPGGWDPNAYNWINELVRLRLNYGIEILIGIDIDRENERANSIFLTEPRVTLLPPALCSSLAEQSVIYQERDYEHFQTEISRNMHKWFKCARGEANRLAGDIIRFEFSICSHMRQADAMQNATRSMQTHRGGMNRIHGTRQHPYPRHNLKQFTQQFRNVIDFKHFVDNVFESTINEPVYMRAESYFQNLANVLKDTNKVTMSHYITYTALVALNLPNDDHPRGDYCVNLVHTYLPKVIGKMYQQKYERPEVSTDLTNIFNDIQATFEKSLKNNWLTENNRRAAKQKLQQMQAAFPTYEQPIDLTTLDIERSNFWKNLRNIMKFKSKNELGRLYRIDDYSKPNEVDMVEATDIAVKVYPMQNVILVGWGLMQAPFYQIHYGHSLKYSLLGQYLARELVKAFDEQRWHSNAMATLRWDDYTVRNFRIRTECYRQQYSNYLYNKANRFHNASKLRELVADAAGLRIAFNAYIAWLGSMDTVQLLRLSKETLPGVNFTNTQLFFINFAQTRCSAKYEEHGAKSNADFMPLNSHTDERYMVNGPLNNFDEFAREFGCQPGTGMNPDEKCVVY